MGIQEERKTIWEQFVDQKSEWIGGTLRDYESGEPIKTTITDIEFRPNGGDHMWFGVEGEGWGCGFDTRYGGVSGQQVEGELTFSGYAGHRWSISKPVPAREGI